MEFLSFMVTGGIILIAGYVLGVNITLKDFRKSITTDWLFRKLCEQSDIVWKFDDGVKWYADLKDVKEMEAWRKNERD